VYKNTGSGWEKNTGSGWSPVNDPARTQQLSRESSARQTGQQRYNSFESNGGASRNQSHWGGANRQMSRPAGGGARRR
jgi:hypothetical protein